MRKILLLFLFSIFFPVLGFAENIKIGVKSSSPVDFPKSAEPSDVQTKKGIKNNVLTFERSPLVKDEIVRNTTIKEKKSVPNGFPKPPKIMDTEEKIKIIEKEDLEEKKTELHGIFSSDAKKTKPKSADKKKKKTVVKKVDRLTYEQDLLYSTIKKHGKELRRDLCKTFILQIRTKLKRSQLDDDYIVNAAKLYIQKIDDQ